MRGRFLPQQLSAKSYLLGFSLFGLLLFGVFGSNLLLRGSQIQQAIVTEKRQAAEVELERAMDTVFDELSHTMSELVSWDEVHQQLGDATYYVYWRENRLKRSSRFPPFVHGLELYDAERQALITLPYANFPATLPSDEWFIERVEGRQYLFSSSPIPARDGSNALHGYLALRVDLVEAVKTLNRFVNIRPDSLKLVADAEGLLDSSSAAALFSYDIVAASTSSRLGQILESSLRDFFLLFVSMLVVFYLVVSFLFVRPLGELGRYIMRLRRGDGEGSRRVFVGPLPTVAELITVRDSLSEYQGELDRARSRLDQQNAELWQLAHQDALTGAKNRLAFDEDWRELVQLAQHRRLDVSLILLDCDFFKAINDTYGHEVGDRVIQSIAESLQGVLREGERLYRLGGDEFVTVLLNAGGDEAYRVAQRCVESVQQHAFKQLGIREEVKLSVGLAHARGTDIANLSELPRQADVAMYHAKGATRDKIVHYTPSLERSAAALVSNRIVGAVLQALESGEGIDMHYQPLVSAADRQVVFYEALVRIRDKDEPISPADIFPIITRRRLDVELDKAVLLAVERDLRSGLLPPGVGVSINVSGALIALNDFCHYFTALSAFLEQHPIIVEITETTFISHLQHASSCLQKLRNKGFRVALDDFGSGYSSIRYLANMPVDIVKFDIAMVHDLNKDQRTRIIIEHTARLITEAGYELVAEGIEDEAILERVGVLRPTYLQGYLFGSPLPLRRLFP